MALFSGMQSRQGLTSPVGFTGYVALLTHGVGSICGSRMSPAIMLSRARRDGFFALNWHLASCLLYRCDAGVYLDGVFSLQTANSVKRVRVHCCQLFFVFDQGFLQVHGNIGISLHRGNSFTEPTLVKSLGSCWH